MGIAIKKQIAFVAFLGLIGLAFMTALYPSEHPLAQAEQLDKGNIAWMLTATALVLLMTPGLSFFYGGMVRAKNILSTMLQSFIAMGAVSLLWYAVGFSLCFGESLGGFIGNPFSYALFNNVGTAPHSVMATGIPFMLFAAFQLKFAIITPALITGSFAERIKFWAYVLFMILFSLIIYCPVAHWVWNPDGFLCKMGALDFAGGAVIHLSAGIAALAGALVLGKRISHQNNEPHVPSNIPFIILGTGLLWFGWFGFNAGSSLEANEVAIIALTNTNMASASAMIAWILLDMLYDKKPNAVGACIGAVVGLATITPAAGFVSIGFSILIGIIGTVCSYYAVRWKTNAEIDDTLDVFPCHGIGGIVGMVCTGIFAQDKGLFYGKTDFFLVELLTIAIIGLYSFVGCWLIMKLIRGITPLRVNQHDEQEGLDRSQHNEEILDTKIIDWLETHVEPKSPSELLN